MIEVIDRIPTYPGRVKLIPVPGQADTYDMVRADEPIVVGTPLNKALFDSMQNLITEAVHTLDNKIFEFSQFSEISSLADGASFALYENGILTPYIKLKNNYEGTGRTLVLRRNVTHQDVVYPEDGAEYGSTAANSWLNNDFLTRFDATTQAAISEVPIDVADKDDTLVQINRRVFLLSLYEFGGSMNYVTKLGDPVAAFTSTDKRVALYNGVPVAQHTRSCDTYFDTFCVIKTDGDFERLGPGLVAGIRPAFTLPPSFSVIVATYTTANHVVAKSEVI